MTILPGITSMPELGSPLFEARLCLHTASHAVEAIINSPATPEATRAQLMIAGKMLSQAQDALAAFEAIAGRMQMDTAP